MPITLDKKTLIIIVILLAVMLFFSFMWGKSSGTLAGYEKGLASVNVSSHA